MIYIYALVCPYTYKIRYVGKSMNHKQRYDAHIRCANNVEDTRLYRWIRKLIRTEEVPMLHLLDIVEDVESNLAECAWIYHYRYELGVDLTNSTDGGDSGLHTKASKEKISAKLKLYHSCNPDAIKGENNPNYGRGLKGESNPNYGRKPSEETKRKMSEARTLYWKNKKNEL